MDRKAFYDSLPLIRDFETLASGEGYTPLPGKWLVGCADITGSTRLIAEGRYKTVNMIGASVISAMANTLGGRAFPFVFGGDGASFAVPAEDERLTRQTLARLRSWTASQSGVDLRAALVPVSWIREAGQDVRVARYAPSDGVDYAMFSGGGLAWAERQMKAGGYAVQPATDGEPPDLSGLSCRWNSVPSRNGTILSLVLLPAGQRPGADFARIAAAVSALAAGLDRSGHPLPAAGPPVSFPAPGLLDEARLTKGRVPYVLKRLQLMAETTLAALLFSTGWMFKGFDPSHYRQVLSANADFRKFDDGLKMTLDCPPDVCARLKSLLDDAAAAGHIRYGLHEQDSAMVTCIVPSLRRDDHMHFVDGAAGGYTSAAAQIRPEPEGRTGTGLPPAGS